MFRGPNEWWKSRSFDGKIGGLGGTISSLHGEITGFGGAVVSGLDGKGSGLDGEVHANRRPKDFIGAIIGGERKYKSLQTTHGQSTVKPVEFISY